MFSKPLTLEQLIQKIQNYDNTEKSVRREAIRNALKSLESFGCIECLDTATETWKITNKRAVEEVINFVEMHTPSQQVVTYISVALKRKIENKAKDTGKTQFVVISEAIEKGLELS
jgi:NaMN:DMB phosphoribosyltransferase